MLRSTLLIGGIILLPTIAFANVECSNDKGECQITDNGNIYCECLDGTGEGWAVASIDGDIDSDSELMKEVSENQCNKLLIENCPNPAPDSKKDCKADALQMCQDLYGSYSKCIDDFDSPTELSLVKCCNDYEEYQNPMRWLLNCLDNNDCDTRPNTCFEEYYATCDGDGCPIGPATPSLSMAYKDELIVGELEENEGCKSMNTQNIVAILIMLLILFGYKKRLAQTN